MSANAIFAVTQAFRERLELALLNSGVPGAVFVGPLDDDAVSDAKLILFLYRVVPNPSLRNREHRVTDPDSDPPVRVYRNSLPLDLYFLLTVGTTKGGSEETLLRALGHAMRAMQAEPDLAPQAPAGEPAIHETVHVSLESLSTEEASRIWALFPVANYRTSVAYLATPVWIDPVDEPALAPVITDDRLNGVPTMPAAPL